MKFIILLSVLFIRTLLAQDIVINEYYNNSFGEEWVELIVIKDKLDLRNCIIRDNASNSGILNSWQGAVKFKDIDLWKDLKKGTILIISFNRQAFDKDPSDGLLMVSSLDNSLFDNSDRNEILSLKINKLADIIQILDKDGNEIHSLAHSPRKTGYLDSLSGAWLCFPESSSDNVSIQVYPGSNISDYKKGYDQGKAYTRSIIHQDNNIKAQANSELNRRFIESLRAPKFSDVSFKVKKNWNRLRLEWEHITHEKSVRYLIIRTIDGDLDEMPENSIEYSKGDLIGNGEVIYSGDNKFTFDNYANYSCTDKINYYLFLFNYLQSNTLRSPIIGPCYQLNDFEKLGIEIIGKRPLLISNDGDQNICSNSEYLVVKHSEDLYHIKWYFNGSELEETGDSLLVRDEGTYQAEIFFNNKCSIWTDTLEMRKYISEYDLITLEGKRLYNDTNMQICSNEQIELKSNSSNTSWYKNSIIIDKAENLIINSTGVYQAITQTNSCLDSSCKVSIEVLSSDILIEKKNKNLIVISNTDSLNKGSVNIISERSLIKIPDWIWIDANDRVELNIPDIFNDDLLIFDWCGKSDTVKIEKSYKNALSVLSDTIDLGTHYTCFESDQFYFDLFNISNKNVKINNITSRSNILSFTHPIYISDSCRIWIDLDDERIILEDQIKVAYEIESVRDTLEFNLLLELNEESFLIKAGGVEVSTVDHGKINECENEINTIIEIVNPNSKDLNLDIQSEENTDINKEIIVPAMSSIFLDYSINTNSGFQKTDLIFITKNCKEKKILSDQYYKINYEIVPYDPNSNFFEYNSKCLGNKDISFLFKVYSNSKDPISISKIDADNIFPSKDIFNTDLVSDSTYSIKFNFFDLEPGYYSDTLMILFSNCDSIQYEFDLLIYDDSLSISDDIIADIYPYDTLFKTIDISNYGFSSYELKRPQNPSTNFHQIFPIHIPPLSVKTLSFDYYTEEYEEEQIIELNFNENNCDQTIKKQIQLNSVKNTNHYLINFELIPIDSSDFILKLDCDDNYKDLKIDSVIIDLIFNPTLLKLNSVNVLDPFTNDIKVSTKQLDLFNYRLTINNLNNHDLDWGEWLKIELESFVGNASKSALILDPIVFSKNWITPLVSLNTFINDSICLYEQFILGNGEVTLNIINGQIIDRDQKLIVETKSNVKFRVNVYDINGRFLRTYFNQKVIELNEYEKGIYIIELEYLGKIKVMKILLE